MPLPKGIFVTNYLKKYFDFVLDPLFSSTMQDKFTAVGTGSLRKEQFIDKFIFGTNETTVENTPLSLFFKDGLFRSITKRIKSKLQINKDMREPKRPSPIRTQFLGEICNQPVSIGSSIYGNFLKIGNSTAGDTQQKVQFFPLPSWLSSSLSVLNMTEVLEFSNLPRTFCYHPSTNQPITLLMSKGLLWLQLGKERSAVARRVPLEAGILPSDLTKTLVLNKISRITSGSEQAGE
jgi:hypothetical protein